LSGSETPALETKRFTVRWGASRSNGTDTPPTGTSLSFPAKESVNDIRLRAGSLSAGKFCREFFFVDRERAIYVQLYATAAIV
jgi:hypothetical protein